MAWTASRIFVAYLVDRIMNTNEMDLPADTVKVALYNNTTVPSHIVTAANSAYAVGEWVVANEVHDDDGWPPGGNTAVDALTDNTAVTVMYDITTDTASLDAHTTLANVYGCLVYDDTIAAPVADQGVCYNSFGGGEQTVGGRLQ